MCVCVCVCVACGELEAEKYIQLGNERRGRCLTRFIESGRVLVLLSDSTWRLATGCNI